MPDGNPYESNINWKTAKAAAEIQRENGFDITSIQLKLEGYCPKCKQKEGLKFFT